MPFQFKEVTLQIKALIDLGDQVIRDCRALVAMGAGNQRHDVTRTQGRSAHLTYLVQHSPNYVWDRPLRNGGVTSAYGSGNCQDQAAVTYTILRSKLSAAETISFCVNNAIHHSFATIGNPDLDPPSAVICVDPWPLNAQALLLDDHFCKVGLTVLRTKTGGKDPNYQARLAKHAPADAVAVRQYANQVTFDVKAINTGPGMWTHEYCSKHQITWVYKVRPVWIPDSQRLRCHGCNTDFTIIRRRHHCRSCGEIFCDNCSTSRTIVGVPATEPNKPNVNLSDGAVRVCAPCLQHITVAGFGG